MTDCPLRQHLRPGLLPRPAELKRKSRPLLGGLLHLVRHRRRESGAVQAGAGCHRARDRCLSRRRAVLPSSAACSRIAVFHQITLHGKTMSAYSRRTLKPATPRRPPRRRADGEHKRTRAHANTHQAARHPPAWCRAQSASQKQSRHHPAGRCANAASERNSDERQQGQREMTGITDGTTRKHLRDLASEGGHGRRQPSGKAGALLRHGMNMIKNSTRLPLPRDQLHPGQPPAASSPATRRRTARCRSPHSTRGAMRWRHDGFLPRMMAPSLSSNSCATPLTDQRPGAAQRHARRL